MRSSILAVLCALLCMTQTAANGSVHRPYWAALTNQGDIMIEIKGDKMITISCNGKSYNAALADNTSAEAFYALLQKGDITFDMHDYGGFEKAGNLPDGQSIVKNDTHFEAVPGDFNLFMGNIVAIYYTKITYDFTKLGHIEGATEASMREWLKAGEGNMQVTFSVAK